MPTTSSPLDHEAPYITALKHQGRKEAQFWVIRNQRSLTQEDVSDEFKTNDQHIKAYLGRPC